MLSRHVGDGPFAGPGLALALGLGLLAACAPTDGEAGKDGSEGEPETGDPDSGGVALVPLEPEWDAAAVQSAVLSSLAFGLPEPITMRDWLFDLLHIWEGDWAEVSCPSTVPIVGDGEVHTSSLVGCSSDTYTLNGGWIYDEEILPDGDVLSGSGLFTVTGAYTGGLTFRLGGSIFLRYWTTETSQHSVFKIGGTFEDPTHSGWLGRGVSSGLEFEGEVDAGGLVNTRLVGSLGVAGEDFLYFEGVTMDQDICGGLPIGTVLVRDPSTLWLEMEFLDTCDPCATLMNGDEAMGEVCVGGAIQQAAVDALSLVPEEVPW